MGLYKNQIYPKLSEHFFSSAEFDELRAQVIGEAVGHVLEIGAGTGANFIYYSDATTSLTTIDPNPVMNQIARKKFRFLDFPVDQKLQNVETLTASDQSFDTVVSTFSLCTISDPLAGLAQIRRVLKPNGKFLFLERTQSQDPAVAKWQDRLTPLHKLLWNGSHLNRPVERLISQADFSIRALENFHARRLPKPLASLIYGVATQPGID